MEISVIRARVLAVARSRLWIAVDGTLGASADAQTLLATDPRFVLHTDLQSAWDAWT